MIQFNLLPDVKLQFIKTKKIQRLVFSVSAIAVVVSLVVLLLLFSVVDGLQKRNLSDLNSTISTDTTKIQNTPDLNKILTIQNQLDSLPALDAQKPAVERLFTYIAQLTPANVNINDFKIDFGLHTWNITGTADSLSTINEFVDTLKFTTYKTSAAGSTNTNAFSDVVLSAYGIGGEGNDAASYGINLNYDATIFNSADKVNLTVPNIISTRSEVEQPQGLFSQPTVPLNNTQSGSKQ
jgi:hypothetical protein